MTIGESALRTQLLEPLHELLRAAREVYGRYMSEGKRFAFAVELRRINLEARALLADKGWMLPEASREDAAALIAHWDAWLALWEEHRSKLDPGPDDAFAFANSATFPKESAARLEGLRQALALRRPRPPAIRPRRGRPRA